MHKYLLSLIAFLTLLLTACDQRNAETSYRIGVSQCSDDAWRTKLNEEMQRELLFHPEISLEVRSADNDNNRQAADIDYFIDQHVDLLIVSPNEAAKLTPAVSKAFDAGIPVIVADRMVTGEKYTAFIGGDNRAVGHLMAQHLMMMMPEGGKVLEILGLPGSTPAELRHEGFLEMLGPKADLYEIHQGVANFFKERGEVVADSLLRLYPDVQMILAQNDQMAIGARQAANRLQPGNDIIIIGVDGLTGPGNGVEAIIKGEIEASAVYATGGDIIIQTAVKILNGEPFERNTSLKTYMVDPLNAPLMDNIYQEVIREVDTVQMLKGRIDYFWHQHNLEQALLAGLLVFVGFIIIFIIVLYRQYYIKQRLNESLARQQQTLKQQRDQLQEQNKQLKVLTNQVEEATKAKLMFFTNVSHDFRTPLTLISAPIEKLQSATNLTAEQSQFVQLAQKNVQVLLRLVNQILDFRKYESGKLELNLEAVDLADSVTGWYHSFEGLAFKKHIHLNLQIKDDDTGTPATGSSYLTMGDLPKLERIFFNLMGNAFKFTPENGRIEVGLSRTRNNLIMSIGDTGPGINVEHIQKIFENFYQIDSAHHEGSGIGLALVKNFVELHGGQIRVENRSEGKGTIFTVTLPIREVAESLEQQEKRRAVTLNAQLVEMELAESTEPQELAEDDPKPAVLVIDDNTDILALMRTLLGSTYHVFTAANGQEGIRKAMRLVPDAILCDVMMPVMDGLETCRRLKAEVNTSHIPVMMLTACNLDEQRVQGHQEGADAYLSKPFNNEVLMAQLDALVKNHDRVRDYFSDSTYARTTAGRDAAAASPSASAEAAPAKEVHYSTISSIDEKFLNKMRTLIEAHLSDSEFGVELLGDEIGMSRAQLYRKCKALTNYSPVELIRNTRLKRAQQLLAQGDDTIAQVAYAVGFTAPSYFTKCYKEYFGENPNELVKRKG